MGKTSLRAPRRALLRIPPCRRARSTKSSASDMVPFAPPQKTVIERRGIREPLFIQNQGVGKRTHFQEMVPIAGVACEPGDRKSKRLNSSHSQISYAVFCLKKKKI